MFQTCVGVLGWGGLGWSDTRVRSGTSACNCVHEQGHLK